MEDNDDYDALRAKNIAERNAIFADFFKDIKKQKEEFKQLRKKEGKSDEDEIENHPPKKKRRRFSKKKDENFSCSIHIEPRKRYNTRRSARFNKDNANSLLSDDEEELTEPTGNGPKLKVLFPWAKPMQRHIDLMKIGVCDVDEEEEDDHQFDEYIKSKFVRRVTRAPYDPLTIPSVDEITDKMLANIADKSSNKTYDKNYGTSCHQCRQKTIDTKTICRSGECIGVRGQFCGPCLRGRYGESAYDALKDPDWACPPCRGLCNCSICRTRNGLRPTGILAPMAQEEGFSSVLAYLQSTEPEDT
ncbi:cell division cycle-associated protein 7-like [Prorops nasuta]|uniref:cell division cycle-associated protein 7-like n=1 Tax=Prorops nasuta TaxID=863751 RepID=UPI0034CE92C0